MKAIRLSESAYKILGLDDINLLNDHLPSMCEKSEYQNYVGGELIWVINLNDFVYKGYLIFED